MSASTTLKRRSAGRPPFSPTPEQRAYVLRQRLAGQTVERIALVLGVSIKTLRLRLSAELDHGTRDLLGQIAAVAYQRALAGDSVMLAFVLSRRGGWVEREEVGGGPFDALGRAVGHSRAQLQRK